MDPEGGQRAMEALHGVSIAKHSQPLVIETSSKVCFLYYSKPCVYKLCTSVGDTSSVFQCCLFLIKMPDHSLWFSAKNVKVLTLAKEDSI